MSDEPFRFEITRIRSQFSRREIIGSLKTYSKVHDVPTFRMREHDAWHGRLTTSDTVRRYFGTWGKALKAAELRTVRGHKIDPRAMVEAFKECWKENGTVPSVRQLEAFLENGNFPFRYKSYLNFFGGLGRLAKLVVNAEQGEIPKSDLYERRKSSAFLQRAISLKLRAEILKRDGYRCLKCGACTKIDKSTKLEVGHIIPVARGGLSQPNNLQTLCFSCNQGKKDRDD